MASRNAIEDSSNDRIPCHLRWFQHDIPVLFGPSFANLVEDAHGFADILLIGHPDHRPQRASTVG